MTLSMTKSLADEQNNGKKKLISIGKKIEVTLRSENYIGIPFSLDGVGHPTLSLKIKMIIPFFI